MLPESVYPRVGQTLTICNIAAGGWLSRMHLTHAHGDSAGAIGCLRSAHRTCSERLGTVAEQPSAA